jgi:hypothetical protein
VTGPRRVRRLCDFPADRASALAFQVLRRGGAVAPDHELLPTEGHSPRGRTRRTPPGQVLHGTYKGHCVVRYRYLLPQVYWDEVGSASYLHGQKSHSDAGAPNDYNVTGR